MIGHPVTIPIVELQFTGRLEALLVEKEQRQRAQSIQLLCVELRQAEEGTRVEEVGRKAGVSRQTYYRWRKKYGGLMPSEMRRRHP